MTDAKPKEELPPPHDDTTAIMKGLEAIDEQIRATLPGEPGTGLHALLDRAASQFFGVPRSAFPVTQAKAENEAKAEPKPEAKPKDNGNGKGGPHGAPGRR